VLVDTEIWWDEVRQEFAARRGRPWTVDDRAAVMGQNSPGWARTMHDRLGLDEPLDAIEAEVVDAMVARLGTEPAPMISGAPETVRRLGATYPLGLASSAHPAVIAAALRAARLIDEFRAIAASDEVPNGKPSPDVFLLAADRLGVDPRRCLVVEDSLNGVLAGRAAGMLVVHVPNPAVPPAPGTAEAADLVLPSIAEVPVAVAALEALADDRSPAAASAGTSGRASR
jgi:HAD superfamily hydrolase (TIGR01509 family)